MKFDLESLTDIAGPPDLATCELAELRTFRTRLQEVENGLSYSRRMIQGRLDTLAAQLENRRLGADVEDLVTELPRTLADKTRGSGSPRPPVDLEPPEWADEIVAEIDQVLTPVQVAGLSELPEAELTEAIMEIAAIEREVSAARHEIHRRIDAIQDEMVGRYRDGASVDDLLR